MVETDTLSGQIRIDVKVDVAPYIADMLGGTKKFDPSFKKSITDGTGTDQATGCCGGTVTVTTGGITLSLADSADPFGTGGDDVPTEDPEGKKLRLLLIRNLDSTNYMTVSLGANALAGFLGGTTPTARIDAGGFGLWYWPSGNSSAMNDTVDDEIVLTANTASVSSRIFYTFG